MCLLAACTDKEAEAKRLREAQEQLELQARQQRDEQEQLARQQREAQEQQARQAMENARREFSKHLVIIEGNQSSGSGFIAMFHDRPVLFTNSYVLSGNSGITARLLNGQSIAMRGFSMADTYDVSVFQQDTAKAGFELLQDVGNNVHLGDAVVVLGNRLGAGVATELKGTITGIGPELIEVDADFVEGNSGSPVIHVKTATVIGIATLSTVRNMDGLGKDSKFKSVARRFAYRIDNIPTWKNPAWQVFVKESAILNKITQRTDDVWNLADDVSSNGEIHNWPQHLRRDNFLSVTVANWQKELARRDHVSAQQTFAKKKGVIDSVLAGLHTDLLFIKPETFTAYHRKQFDEQIRERKLLTSYFEALGQQLSTVPQLFTK